MDNRFQIIIEAVQKGFDTTRSQIKAAFSEGLSGAGESVAKLNEKIKTLESTAASLQTTLNKIEGFKKLQSETQALADKWQAAQKKADDLAKEIRETDGDVVKLSRAFNITSKEAENLERRFNAKKVALSNLETTLIKAGVDTNNLAGSQANLSAKLKSTESAIASSRSAFAAAEKPTVSFFSNIKGAAGAFTDELNKNKAAAGGWSGYLKTALAGIGVKKVTEELFDAGRQASNLAIAFEAIAGSTEGAKAELGFIREISNELKMDFYSTAEAYKGIFAASKGTNLEGEKTRDIFKAIAEASTALRLSSDQTSGSLYAISQMMSKGKIAAEELRGQLGERLPGAFNLTAEAMGITTAELDKLLKEGKVVAEDVLPKLAAVLHDKYGAAAEKAAKDTKNAQGALNAWKNAWMDFKVQMSDSGFMQAASDTLKNLTDKLKDPAAIKSMSDLAKAIFDTIGAVVKFVIEYGKWIAIVGVGYLTISKTIDVVKALNAALVFMTGIKSADFFRALVIGATDAIVKMDLLTKATVFFSTTLGKISGVIAAAGIGAAIGAWLNSFESVRVVTQLVWADLDKFFTNAKIGYLEVARAWNEFWGKDEAVAAIDKQIAAQKAHLKEIERTKDAIIKYGDAAKQSADVSVAAEEKKREAAAKTREAAMTNLEKVEAAQKASIEASLAAYKAYSEEKKAILSKELADSELAEAKKLLELSELFKAGIISTQQYEDKRSEITREAAAERLEMEKKGIADRIDVLEKQLAMAADAYADDEEKRVKAEQEITKEIHGLELDLTKLMIKEAQERTQVAVAEAKKQTDAAVDADAEKVASARAAHDQKIALLQEETQTAAAELALQLKNIDDLEDEGVLDHDEAVNKKIAAEQKFFEKKVELARKAMEAAVEAFGQESSEYIAALADMEAAQEELAEIEAEAAERQKEAAEGYIAIWAAAEQRYRSGVNTFKELLAEIESYIGKMSTGPYDLVGMQYEEAMERLGNIRGEFEAVRDAAEKAFNIKWDISGMNLPEMKGAVAEIAGMFQDLYARVSETSRQIEASGASVDAWTGHLTDAQLALSEFKAKTEGFQETMGMLFDDAPKDLDALKDAMKNVEAAYADVVSAGAAAVDALKGQWDDLAGKIAETEEKIKALYADTAETIRELQRKTMSDEKAWLDEKLEANQVYNQAVAEMNQGNVDAALELFAKARDIAKGLAQEVKDESGQVVMSLEQNTETAISMITQISDAEKNILQSHQQELITNQAKVGQSIDQTLTKMQELSAKASQIDRDMPDWWYDMEGPDWPPQFAEGGLAAGPKHSRGGMIIEVEGGEYVQPDKAMSRYGRLGLAFQEAFRQMKIPKGALAELMERLTMGGLSRAEWGTRLLSGAANAMAHIEMIVPKFETGGAVAGAGAMAGGFDLGIKDMGRTDLNFDGKAYPVMGKVDVLAELQAAFARKKRLRSNS